MQTLLFTLIQTFEFELNVRPEDVSKRTAIAEHPTVVGKAQLPLIIRSVRA